MASVRKHALKDNMLLAINMEAQNLIHARIDNRLKLGFGDKVGEFLGEPELDHRHSHGLDGPILAYLLSPDALGIALSFLDPAIPADG